MYRYLFKIIVLVLLLLNNSKSLGMLCPFQHNPDYIEGLYVQAHTNGVPLQNALTLMQLSLLAHKRFNESMPKSTVQCNGLYEPRNERVYQKYIIDRLQEERLAIFSALPMANVTNIVQTQFQLMAKRLIDDEHYAWKNLIQYLVKTYKVNEQSIPSYDELKKHGHMLLAHQWNNTLIDKDLPIEWVSYLEEAMAENDYNLSHINVLTSHDDDYDKYIAFCRGPSTTEPAAIMLNKKEYKNNYSIEEKKALKHSAYHEVTHLLRGHSTMRNLTIAAVVAAFSSVQQSCCHCLDINKFKQNIRTMPAYISLTLAMERSADVLSALKNPEIAFCGRSSSNVTYSGSYNYLATIDTNWTALKLIQENRTENTLI